MKEYFNNLYKGSGSSLIQELETCLEEGEKKFIITANPETFMLGKNNSGFDEVLKSKRVTVVPDGIGLVKGAGIIGLDIKERITGVELCEKLFKILNKQKGSIYLFGAEERIGAKLCERLKREYPNIELKGYTNGYVKNKDEIMQKIIQTKPDVALVALGIPNQEMLISKYFDEAEKGVFIGVGGSFDVLSGEKKRAPQIFIKLNLEWLYRIAKEPKRIKRFYVSNVKFIKELQKLKRKGGIL